MEQYTANDLLIFARVVAAGSFSRAAERMGMPKATVSRRIAQLEESLGERLLLRTTRRLNLTEFGEHLLEHARQLDEELGAVKALVEHRQARPSGRLRISMPNDFASLMLTDMLHAFVVMHPEVSLEIDLSQRRVDLLAENFDLAIRMGQLPDDSLLTARRIASFAFGLYASPRYLLEHGTPEHPEALLEHECLCLPGPPGQKPLWQLSNGQQNQVITPPGRLLVNSPQLLIHLAQNHGGVASVPDYFAKPYLASGALQRVLPTWQLPTHPAWAVFPGRRLMPAKTRAFLDMLETALGSTCQVQ